MRRQDRIIGLDHGVRHRWGGVYTKLKLRLLAIIGRQPLKDESSETRSSSTAKGVEDEEALQTTAIIRQAADLVHYSVDHLLADSIVTAGI